MRKLSFEFVKNSFESEGYKLLDNEYRGWDCKLTYICSNGHKHGITWSNWHQGCRCPYCYNESRKIDINLIRQEFANEGYILLTTDYVNNKQRLDCICSKGHKCTIMWATWNSRGDRCIKCKYEQMASNQIGPGNSQWKGGISCEPYCDVWVDKEYKKSILERDAYTCQNCGITNMLSMSIFGRKLNIHHIDYNKKNCRPNNLITVCSSCNSKANTNRAYWGQFYKQKERSSE